MLVVQNCFFFKAKHCKRNSEWIHEWLNEWVKEQTNEGKHRWINEWMSWLMKEPLVNEWMNKLDGSMNEPTNEQMKESIDKSMH